MRDVRPAWQYVRRGHLFGLERKPEFHSREIGATERDSWNHLENAYGRKGLTFLDSFTIIGSERPSSICIMTPPPLIPYRRRSLFCSRCLEQAYGPGVISQSCLAEFHHGFVLGSRRPRKRLGSEFTHMNQDCPPYVQKRVVQIKENAHGSEPLHFLF